MSTKKQIREVGDKVRYYRYGPGWMFGVVQLVCVVDGMEMATVHFPGRPSGYGAYPEQTVEIASFLLERCS